MVNKIWKFFIFITRVTVLNLNTRGVIIRFELINILCANKHN